MPSSTSFFIGLTAAVALSLVVPAQPLQAQPAADILIVRMALAEGAALVKLSGGQPQMVRVGDDLYGWGTVRGISSDRLVIEQIGAAGNELIVIRRRNGEQTVERIGQMTQPDQTPRRLKSRGLRKSWKDSD